MTHTRIEKDNSPHPANLAPGRAAALDYIAAELESDNFIPPATLEWMARGAILSQRIDPDLELLVEGEIVPGRENAFILKNKATGNGNFDIPGDPGGFVRDNQSGRIMGRLKDISELGRWIVGVAIYSREQVLRL